MWAALDDDVAAEDELNCAALDNCALADEDCTILADEYCAMADEDCTIAAEDCAIAEEDCAKLAESLMARIGEMVCCLTESANGCMRVKRLSGEPSEWAIEKAPKNAMINKILRYML